MDDEPRDPADTFTTVSTTLAQALEFDITQYPLTADDLLADLPGASSLALVRAVALLERELGLALDNDALLDVRTLGDVCELVDRLARSEA